MQMTFGKRRDEWDRLSSLMCLIADRTNFSDKPNPADPLDFIPPYLVERESVKPQPETPLEPITVKDLIAMAGVR